MSEPNAIEAGRTELSVRDALVGEILGEMILVRKGITDFQAVLPGVLQQVEKSGELVTLRLAEQARAIAVDLDERTAKLTHAAAEFRAVRELLMGELGVKTAAQFDTALQSVAVRMSRVRRGELLVATLGGAVLAAVFVLGGLFALKHF